MPTADFSRYSRQTLLPEIGQEGQKIFSETKVLCVGAGGLGSPLLLYLSSAGIGTLGIIDFDTIDETNLQRQILFNNNQVGLSKAKIAEEKILALNPSTKVFSYNQKLSAQNALQLFESYDIIVDGTDNFSTKYLINDAAVKLNKPVVYGSVLQFDGQVSVFSSQHGPCYRCLYPEPPKGHVPNCQEAGVLGAVVGIVGTIQATEVLKLAIYLKNSQTKLKPLIGKMSCLDARAMSFYSFALQKNPSCPCCSKNKSEINMPSESESCLYIPEVRFSDLNISKTIFIDVREDHELSKNRIENSFHLPLSQLIENFIPEYLSKDKEYVLYCELGQRSLRAAELLKQQGYKVKNLKGGVQSLK